MQNLTLPTSQTLALGNTLNSMDAIKNSVNPNQSSIEPNNSFEMMLKKQVKANKEAMQDKTVEKIERQRNANKSTLINQKKSQVKADQQQKVDENNLQEYKSSQSVDEILDSSISITQMMDDAKALLGERKNEELSSDIQLLNVPNQEFSQQAAVFSNPSSIVTPTINSNQIQSTDVDLNSLNLDKSLLESKQNQSKLSIALHAAEGNESDSLDAKQGIDLNGKDLPQERLIWASVSSSKSNLNQSQGSDIVNKSMADSTKLLDTVNSLNISTSQQNQPTTSNSILPMHQLGSSNQIHAYPGKTGWDQAISQKIVWMVGAAEQTATLSLNPPDLGPLQVVINVSNNMADTTFISNNAEVRQALQDGMANLREKMAESGIQLGQANVNSGGRSQQEFSAASSNYPSTRLSETDANSSSSSIKQTTRVVRVNDGLVDTFA
jgi:flagellar hook-length control protein FliK